MKRDPGLQPERTALAWGRTALAVFVNALLVLRAGLVGAHPDLVGLGALLLFGAALLQIFSFLRRHLLTGGAGSAPTIAAPASMMFATAALTALACTGLALSIVASLSRG